MASLGMARGGHSRIASLGMIGVGLVWLAVMVTSAWAAGPALTTIQDTIYRADATPAAGTVLIAWPAFTAGEGDPVAAGNQSVAIGTGGAFTTQLVPNVGATPAGTYYTVVFQLDDGTVRTEFWAVPATSPATLAQVRTTPGRGRRTRPRPGSTWMRPWPTSGRETMSPREATP